MKYYMAPMEGLTGYIYRNAYQKYFHDIDRYFTPFITNKKLDFKVKKDIDPEHNQGMEVVPQILTNQPDDFISIVKQLKQYGYDEVNLNLGCPSGTVVAKNRGAGFLAVPDQLDSFLDKIFNACDCKISIKTAQPLAGIPDRQNCRSSHHTGRLHQLSFPQKNIWLPCMETGNPASTFNGYL